MAELVLSAVLHVLFEKMMSHELLKFATQEGVGSKLKKLEKTLKMIDALLIDAEEKQLRNRAVKMWLEELQDLAYDAEDILDEYTTEALKRKLKTEEHQASTSRARKLIPACCFGSTPRALWSDHFSMRSKIDGITNRLLDLCNQRTEFGLVEIAGGRQTDSWERPPTTSLQIEPVVYGRDEDKAKILKMLLSEEPNDGNYGVVSIVGMGGLGKTTLAQYVYNDDAMKNFNPKGWVCISDDFDVTKISIAILESFTGSATDSNLKNLDAVQRRLKEKVAGRKFLLVLDDVWSEDYSKWQILRSPFMAGAHGSKIIVTTRHERVALTMGHSNGCHRLLGLSGDDCWSLFKEHAIGNDVMSSLPVELIRQKVVEKCKGLPLAARALGGLLRSKKRENWLEILNSKTWESLDRSEIPEALQISYYHLPPHLKRCFVYCAILPKDYQFEENELILLWMAEGLIQQSNNNDNNKQLEDLGCEYFYDLLSRSIFQISSHSSSKYIMHDLINDLAQMVSRELSFRLEGELESNNQLRISKKTRYASYMRRTYNLKRRFEVFNDVVCLRTHLSMPQLDDWQCYISDRLVSDLFWRFKKLRVLSLQKYYIVKLPNSIGGLKLLRYLNLSDTTIKSLPESIKLMCNLQTLILRNCYKFSKWSSSMGNLINLRHIDILGANSIKHMPMGVKKWEQLRTLSNFIVSKNCGSRLKDLKHLKFLGGELHISELENMIVLENAIESILDDKKDLKVLLLEWGSRFDESQDEEMDKKILDMLRPHQNVEKLTINGYGGKTFSSWVGNSSFSKMTILKLEDCKRCTSLPSLGLLGLLKILTIKDMKGLKSIGSTFYGQCCSNPFISLETLCFENLEECESWDPIKENESFHSLQELCIVNCRKLSKRLPNNLSTLKKLVIHKCEQLVVSLSNMPKLCELELDECKKIVCTSSACLESLKYMSLSNISDFDDLLMQELKKVQNLKLEGCKELIELWQNEIFLEKPHQGLPSLSSLKKLDFSNCNTLTTLLEGIKQKNVLVEELSIESCNSLKFVFIGQLSQSLKKLHVEKCEKLQCLLGDNVDSSTSLSSATFLHASKEVNTTTSHLEDLYIRECLSLTCLSSIDRLSLTSLHISDCPKLTSLSLIGHLPVALKHLIIKTCSELTTLLPNGHFPETLETLEICGCEKLESTVEKLHNNKALYSITILYCQNLKSLPEGMETLSNLKSLMMAGCGGLASFPKGGFPNSNLRVGLWGCKMLEALSSGIHTLSSLAIHYCPNISLSEEDLPTKLKHLGIKSIKQFKVLMERGFHNFTSLMVLHIHGGGQEGESIQEKDMEITLPPNLTELWIGHFPKLKCLPFNDFQGLSFLERLSIGCCPKLTSLPSILPSSLLQLIIWECPSLKEAYKRDKGKEWSKIADIPHVDIE